ncbi:hypothetical protein [Myxosarcina sp. GI1]|uniref:PFE-CTERM domain-containing protein n=1 Tax=Myxosarcina sp. GI1 TaxID=1541065 RepID=UPI0005676DE0|nr:hypothetical protein [Myxosarcina sp. GI1]
MNIYRLLATTGAIAGTLFHAVSAYALTFSLNNYDSSSGVFSYDVTLDPNEPLEAGFDYISLTNLTGITNTSAVAPYSTDGYDTTSADFLVSTSVDSLSQPQTFENVISLTSNSPLGTIDYEATSDFFANEFSSTAQGPTAVPFELSPDIGLFTIFGIFGLNYYRKKFRAK